MNSKHPLYREVLKVQRELSELEKIQSNSNWVELEHPYKKGYYKTFDLRSDIKNREDAWVFYECIELVGTKAWWKNRSFKKKIGKGKYEYINPEFGRISEDVYKTLKPAVKKYFTELSYWEKYWNPFRKVYKCIAPSYYFVDKIIPRWITHRLETESSLERRICEKEDYLKKDEILAIRYGSCNAPKSYCKAYNRSDRRHNKHAVNKNVSIGGDFDAFEYRYGHRHSARWDYW